MRTMMTTMVVVEVDSTKNCSDCHYYVLRMLKNLIGDYIGVKRFPVMNLLMVSRWRICLGSTKIEEKFYSVLFYGTSEIKPL